MILAETINKLIRDIINLVLSSPDFAIKAKQTLPDGTNPPRPTGSYAAVDFVSDTSIGWEQQELTNNGGDPDLTETIKGMREIMMSVDFFRSSAIDNARSVRTRLVRESIKELMGSAGLGLTRRSEVREISEALENGWEERAQFDIILSAVGSDADLVRAIETVDIQGAYQARGLEYIIDIEVL